jgi:hypothetical protein
MLHLLLHVLVEQFDLLECLLELQLEIESRLDAVGGLAEGSVDEGRILFDLGDALDVDATY